MEKTKDYEMLAENLCDIHFLYSKDLSNVFEQHSTRGEEAALFWLSKLETPVSAGELASKLGITSGRIANILSSLDRKIHRTPPFLKGSQADQCCPHAGRRRSYPGRL